MKYFFCGLCLLALVNVLSASAATADEQSASQDLLENKLALVEPGVLPDSFWYWADVYTEELRYITLWGKENRADYLLIMAEERLAEMKKLSEEGIKGYADKLMTRHEALVYKAGLLYAEVKTEAAARAVEIQADTEDEIYRQELQVKDDLRNAPETLATVRDSVGATILNWFKSVKDHLRWKKAEVEEQRADFPGY